MKHVMFAIGRLTGGGAERVVSVWANELVQKGYDVSIVVFAREDHEYFLDEKIKVYTVADTAKECEKISPFQRVKKIRKTLKLVKPDTIISFLPLFQVYIRYASFGLGIKRIETVRNNPWKASAKRPMIACLWKRCFKKSAAVILQSEDQRAFFSKKIQKKTVVIPNPINVTCIQNKKSDYCNNSHKLVAAGRLTEQKNYRMMIDAAAYVAKQYPDVRLNIFGEGEDEKLLKEYIKKVGACENVFLMGRSDTLYEEYIKSDLYLMSSNFEGMPNALAEAMAVGLPCISTNCKTGPRDLIDDKNNGFLVPVGDVVAMAEQIIKIFKMTNDEQRAIGERARTKILTFCSQENSTNKLCKLLESL